MATLTAAKNVRERLAPADYSFPVAASVVIYQGSIVTASPTGFARGAAAGGSRALGIAQTTVNNATGGDGALNVPVRRGCYQMLCSSVAADIITNTDVGNDCYVVDDETVAKTSTGGRVIAGRICAIEMVGTTRTVWVQF